MKLRWEIFLVWAIEVKINNGVIQESIWGKAVPNSCRNWDLPPKDGWRYRKLQNYPIGSLGKSCISLCLSLSISGSESSKGTSSSISISFTGAKVGEAGDAKMIGDGDGMAPSVWGEEYKESSSTCVLWPPRMGSRSFSNSSWDGLNDSKGPYVLGRHPVLCCTSCDILDDKNFRHLSHRRI